MMKKVILAITIVAVLAAASLALAACGTKATTTTTAAPATTTSMAAAPKDIVDTAVAAGSFKTLASLLTSAGLVDTLKGAGPFTVFAPTDEAFAKVPKATLDKLAADPAALKKVLLYHVVAGKVMAADVTDGLAAKTVEGDSLKFAVKGGKVTVNGANVTTADIVCSNGVIHVIDAVLLPPGM
jgi:uncharacterized surface protein with fasciclin (FAS1) repeats